MNSLNVKRAYLAALTSLFISTSVGAVPVTVADLGALTGNTSFGGTIAPNEVVWYSFVADGFTYLDINTNATTGFDTEIGLYDAAGNRIANDDDDGLGLRSTLTFGVGSGLELGDSFNLAGGFATGEDGPLAAGIYYLAFGEFQVNFGDFNFDVTSTGGDIGGDYFIDIWTDAQAAAPAPEPAVLMLLGLGLAGIGFARRRL